MTEFRSRNSVSPALILNKELTPISKPLFTQEFPCGLQESFYRSQEIPGSYATRHCHQAEWKSRIITAIGLGFNYLRRLKLKVDNKLDERMLRKKRINEAVNQLNLLLTEFKILHNGDYILAASIQPKIFDLLTNKLTDLRGEAADFLLYQGKAIPKPPKWGKNNIVNEWYSINDFEIISACYRHEVEIFLSIVEGNFHEAATHAEIITPPLENKILSGLPTSPQALRLTVTGEDLIMPPTFNATSKEEVVEIIKENYRNIQGEKEYCGYNFEASQNESTGLTEDLSPNSGEVHTSELVTTINLNFPELSQDSSDSEYSSDHHNSTTGHSPLPEVLGITQQTPIYNLEEDHVLPPIILTSAGIIQKYSEINSDKGKALSISSSQIDQPVHIPPTSSSNNLRLNNSHSKSELEFISVPLWDGNLKMLAYWISEVNQLAENSEDVCKKLGKVVPLSLIEDAKIWYFSIPENDRERLEEDWRYLKEELILYWTNLQEFKNIKTHANDVYYREPGHANESPSNYVTRKLELVKLAYSYTDLEIIHAVMDKVPTSWAAILDLEYLQTMEEFWNSIRYHEQALLVAKPLAPLHPPGLPIPEIINSQPFDREIGVDVVEGFRDIDVSSHHFSNNRFDWNNDFRQISNGNSVHFQLRELLIKEDSGNRSSYPGRGTYSVNDLNSNESVPIHSVGFVLDIGFQNPLTEDSIIPIQSPKLPDLEPSDTRPSYSESPTKLHLNEANSNESVSTNSVGFVLDIGFQKPSTEDLIIPIQSPKLPDLELSDTRPLYSESPTKLHLNEVNSNELVSINPVETELDISCQSLSTEDSTTSIQSPKLLNLNYSDIRHLYSGSEIWIVNQLDNRTHPCSSLNGILLEDETSCLLEKRKATKVILDKISGKLFNSQELSNRDSQLPYRGFRIEPSHTLEIQLVIFDYSNSQIENNILDLLEIKILFFPDPERVSRLDPSQFEDSDQRAQEVRRKFVCQFRTNPTGIPIVKLDSYKPPGQFYPFFEPGIRIEVTLPSEEFKSPSCQIFEPLAMLLPSETPAYVLEYFSHQDHSIRSCSSDPEDFLTRKALQGSTLLKVIFCTAQKSSTSNPVLKIARQLDFLSNYPITNYSSRQNLLTDLILFISNNPFQKIEQYKWPGGLLTLEIGYLDKLVINRKRGYSFVGTSEEVAIWELFSFLSALGNAPAVVVLASGAIPMEFRMMLQRNSKYKLREGSGDLGIGVRPTNKFRSPHLNLRRSLLQRNWKYKSRIKFRVPFINI